MKRALILFLVAAFLISVWGCTPKSEYQKLLDEKTAVERKCSDLTAKNTSLNDEITARKNESKALGVELRKAQATVKNLEKELTKLKAEKAE